MKEFLRKLKIIEHFSTEIEIEQAEFVSRLQNIVDNAGTGLFANAFDAFSANNKIYKGFVDFEGFKIKRRKTFFDTNISLAKAEGSFSQNGKTLMIEAEINGFTLEIKIMYVGILLFLVAIITTILFAKNGNKNTSPVTFLPIFLFQGIIFLVVPYFLMRKSISRMKYELEREFFYLTKN